MIVLGIGCHPDDLEIQCGGTLAKYAKLGHKVFMCHIANGNMGHKIIMPDELREIRDKEARKAAKTLGAVESISIDVGDLLVDSSNVEIRNKLNNVVREVKPDIIITHYPNDYMRDHMETSRLAFDVSFTCTIPHIDYNVPEHEKFPAVYYMDTLAGIDFNPTEYVDISDEIDVKLEANACHESQVKWMLEHDHIDFLDFIKTCSKYRGLQCGVPFAEGFIRCGAWPKFSAERLLP